MQVIRTEIPEVLVLEPRVFGDARGYFFESYNRRTFKEATGLDPEFVQDNQSRSGRGVLRGLHYQITQPQGKLVRVLAGEVYDVAVDLRRSSKTFGTWVGMTLSAQSQQQLWIPPGFGHGFYVVSDYAEFFYKTTDFYAASAERTILWNDPALGIAWPLAGEPVLAEKDSKGALLRDAEVFA